MEHPKLLFGLSAVLGAVFVTVFATILYLSAYTTDFRNIVDLFYPLGPYPYLLSNALLFSLFIGGPVLLTIGIDGIVKQYFNDNDHRDLVTAVAVVSMLFFTFFLFASILIGGVTVAF